MKELHGCIHDFAVILLNSLLSQKHTSLQWADLLNKCTPLLSLNPLQMLFSWTSTKLISDRLWQLMKQF